MTLPTPSPACAIPRSLRPPSAGAATTSAPKSSIRRWSRFARSVVRSAAGFGAHGVLVPERRAAGMTAAAWKTSAGAAARDELTVRERHLRQWSAENGIGLPLYLRHAAAQESAALHERLDAADGLAHELLDEIRAQSRRLERLEHALAERGVAALWRRARRRVRGWLGRAPHGG